MRRSIRKFNKKAVL